MIAWKELLGNTPLQVERAKAEALRVGAEALVQIASELTVIRKCVVDLCEHVEAEDARKELAARRGAR